MNLKPQEIAEMGIAIALAAALSFVKLYSLPMGGSVTAGSMIPILLLALRRGWKAGIITGALYGVVQFFIDPWSFSPIQILLDYPVAFGLLGLAGFLSKWPLLGIFAGMTGRFATHFVSGIVFFSQYAPERMHPWAYSALYNGSYMLPEFVVSAIIVYALSRKNIIEMYK